MGPFWVRMDLGAIAMKRYSMFPKAPALLEPHRQIVLVSYPGHLLEESYLSAKMQSVYSTATAILASFEIDYFVNFNIFK